MAITREQVADLQPGDVVRLSDETDGWTIEGPLWADPVSPTEASLRCGTLLVRGYDRSAPAIMGRNLAVISRVPRPLYVNHPRSEPVPGDVVRDADSTEPTTWSFDSDHDWCEQHYRVDRREMPERLRLLVDGETGQVVP